MQNYHNFIDELFRLDIDTVQYFVRDGQVLHPDDHHPLPKHYPADTPAERLPGYVSTFLNLDKYNQDRSENRYADTLAELQRRAKKNLILAEPQQASRLLADAKSELERLTRLLKSAIEYRKAWMMGTLDDLPSCFLELRLLDCFIIKNRPQASPHPKFAEHLRDAIQYKRGALSGLIEQVEAVQQPASTLTQIFDVCRLLTFDRLSWLANYSPERPLASFFSPKLSALLDKIGHYEKVNDTLRSELRETVTSFTDYKKDVGLSKVIIENLYTGVLVNGMHVSILDVYRKINDDLTKFSPKFNALGRDRYKPEHAGLMETVNTLFFLNNALYTWSATLINHILNVTPELFDAYRLQFKEHLDLPILNDEVNPSNTPPPNVEKKSISVYTVSALCYYLEETAFNKFTSRAKFVKTELIPEYGFTYASITNKCTAMKKPENRKAEAIENAISIMNDTEKFRFDPAIQRAKADLALIKSNIQ